MRFDAVRLQRACASRNRPFLSLLAPHRPAQSLPVLDLSLWKAGQQLLEFADVSSMISPHGAAGGQSGKYACLDRFDSERERSQEPANAREALSTGAIKRGWER